jgi:NodT family efflux transporter outer membrane factor (OMF) lipoprotein
MHKEDDTRRARPGKLAALGRVALRFGALVAVAGCSVGPNYTRPEVKVNDNWTPKSDPRISTQTAVDSLWWKSFQDSTLDKLVELADRQNLPLQVAALRIVESRAQFAIATGRQFPQEQALFASAAAMGLTSQQAAVLGVQRNFGAYQVGFDAVWELDFWGKFRRGVEAEAASLLGSVTDYYYALVTLTAEVARTYVTIRTYEVLIDQAVENAKVQEQSLQIAESRLRNGATSELDVAQATSLLETTRASIPQLQIKLQQVQNALSALLGQSPGTVTALLTGPKAIPKAPSKVSVSVPAEMLRRRPDIRSAELNAASQCARIGVAKSELYPSFSITGTIGLQTATAAGATSLLSGGAVAYSVGPKIVWPFFNYGRLKNNVRVQDARFQQLLVTYRNTVLKAAQEVEDAMSGFLNSQEAMTIEQRAVQASQRSVEISLAQYREGAADYQRVLDAQRSLLQQENSLAQTNSAVATNLIALYKALGGGWELHQGQPYIGEGTQAEMNDRTDWGDMLKEPRSPEKDKNAQLQANPNAAPSANKNPAPPVNKNPAPEINKNPAPETNKNPAPGKQ